MPVVVLNTPFPNRTPKYPQSPPAFSRLLDLGPHLKFYHNEELDPTLLQNITIRKLQHSDRLKRLAEHLARDNGVTLQFDYPPFSLDSFVLSLAIIGTFLSSGNSAKMIKFANDPNFQQQLKDVVFSEVNYALAYSLARPQDCTLIGHAGRKAWSGTNELTDILRSIVKGIDGRELKDSYSINRAREWIDAISFMLWRSAVQ